MQYTSPLTILPEATVTGLGSRELKLAKNKLLAEFELTGSTTILAGGRQMTKNDVLRVFDQLEQTNDLAFHGLVAADPVLLHFLEYHEIEPGDRFSIPDALATPEFINWISPYFSWAFRKASLRMFREVKPAEFETLVVNPFYMNSDDEWQAWAGVEQYLLLVLENFTEIADAKYHASAQVQKYAGYNFIWLLCNLPEQRFSSFVNKYAFEMMKLAIKEFNNKKRDSGFEIIGYAKSLKVNEETMHSLEAKEGEMHRVLQKNKKTETRNHTWYTIRIVLLIVYVVSRLVTCTGTH